MKLLDILENILIKKNYDIGAKKKETITKLWNLNTRYETLGGVIDKYGLEINSRENFLKLVSIYDSLNENNVHKGELELKNNLEKLIHKNAEIGKYIFEPKKEISKEIRELISILTFKSEIDYSNDFAQIYEGLDEFQIKNKNLWNIDTRLDLINKKISELDIENSDLSEMNILNKELDKFLKDSKKKYFNKANSLKKKIENTIFENEFHLNKKYNLKDNRFTHYTEIVVEEKFNKLFNYISNNYLSSQINGKSLNNWIYSKKENIKSLIRSSENFGLWNDKGFNKKYQEFLVHLDSEIDISEKQINILKESLSRDNQGNKEFNMRPFIKIIHDSFHNRELDTHYNLKDISEMNSEDFREYYNKNLEFKVRGKLLGSVLSSQTENRLNLDFILDKFKKNAQNQFKSFSNSPFGVKDVAIRFSMNLYYNIEDIDLTQQRKEIYSIFDSLEENFLKNKIKKRKINSNNTKGPSNFTPIFGNKNFNPNFNPKPSYSKVEPYKFQEF